MSTWVGNVWNYDDPAAIFTMTDAAADLHTSSYMPVPLQVIEFGLIVSTAYVLGTTNFELRLSTLDNAGTNTARRDLTYATARAVGDYEFANMITEAGSGTTYNPALFNKITVGARFRIRANTAAAGGSAAGAAQPHAILRTMDLPASSTMTRTASDAA